MNTNISIDELKNHYNRFALHHLKVKLKFAEFELDELSKKLDFDNDDDNKLYQMAECERDCILELIQIKEDDFDCYCKEKNINKRLSSIEYILREVCKKIWGKQVVKDDDNDDNNAGTDSDKLMKWNTAGGSNV